MTTVSQGESDPASTPAPRRQLRADADRPPASPDAATWSVTLSCYDDDGKIYAPPDEVLNVSVVGSFAFLDICDFVQSNKGSASTKKAGAMVDAWALLRALALQLGVSELIVGQPRLRSGATQ